eukprot:TRINITY_DN21491_c0_g1_i1.p1 TRINITY_DN21491_c0_g1~~TRINITY_DN21491_c0_g1_i1.p1  ORF type:complete len:282 (+),score=34.42 TRINITY_DN21491_c0_g1_i1:62-907(+)
MIKQTLPKLYMGGGGSNNRNLYRTVDFPKVYKRPHEYYTPFRLYNSIYSQFPNVEHEYSGLYKGQKYSVAGHSPYNLNGIKWPRKLVERKRWGWNPTAKDDGFISKTLVEEKRYETGEIVKSLGENWPEQIMQTWFGKRIQQRRTLTWSEKVTKHRIFPHIHGWNKDADAKTFYSELLDHQFTPAIDHEAISLMESYGGIDQWILQNDPLFLTSWEMEIIRNYLLVRRMELDKNHVMEEQATDLADHIVGLLKARRSKQLSGAKTNSSELINEDASSEVPA